MKNIDALKRATFRFIILSGFIIALAYLIYQTAVFTPTMWAYQYFISGITVGIAYVTFREKNYREGIVLLLLWYIILSSAISKGNYWVFILEGVYICFIALAVHLYIIIIRKSFIKNEISRIIVSTVIIGICNSIIVVVLNLYALGSIYSHLPNMLDAIFINLKIGSMIGLFMGVGIELANYFEEFVFKEKKVAS